MTAPAPQGLEALVAGIVPGGEVVAVEPLSVDARTGGIVKKFHFEETQQSLTDNILNAKKFVARNGRWLSAIELAQEGLRKGLTELGL